MWHLILKENETGELVVINGENGEILYRHQRWTKVLRWLWLQLIS